MKHFLLLIICLPSQLIFAQSPQTYTNPKDQTHLCGEFTLEELSNIPNTEWYQKNYDSFEPQLKTQKLKKKLKNRWNHLRMCLFCLFQY